MGGTLRLTTADRAEQAFPGMVLEGVSINKLRRTYRVISVNGRTENLARFDIASTKVLISPSGGNMFAGAAMASEASAARPGADLVVKDVPGLAAQVGVLNRFLRAFCRPFWVRDERESCGFVIHGGHGTGKTFILQRVANTGWGKVFWIKPSDKLSAVRECFKQAVAQQPSMVLIDDVQDLLCAERPNREAVVEALADELDSLSATAKSNNALPWVLVLATCLDYMADVPVRLQKRSRLRENTALPIPRASERLEILQFFDPPLKPEEKEQCLSSLARKTHAYNGDDLANLVLNAKKILGSRLDEAGVCRPGDAPQYLSGDDMERALRITRPTAMHDINLKPPTIHWEDVGGQESLKKVLTRMIRNTKVCKNPFPSELPPGPTSRC